MKILREKTIIQIKREIIAKMYDCVKETFVKSKNYSVEISNDEILQIVLDNFYKKPTGKIVYNWTNSDDLSTLIKK